MHAWLVRYEQSLTFGPWPYPERRGLVGTSRPIADLPAGVRAISVAELPAAVRDVRSEVTGDVWVVGGGQTARACLDASVIDELELYAVPRLLGDGRPLFGKREALVSTRLVATRAFSNGVVMLRHQVER